MPPDFFFTVESTGYVFGARVTAHLITINARIMDGFMDILPEVGIFVLISLVAFGVGLARGCLCVTLPRAS